MLKQLNCFVIAVLVCIQGNAQNCTLFRTNLIETSISKAISLEIAQQVVKRFTLGIGIAVPLNDNRYLGIIKEYNPSKNEGYAYMYRISGIEYKISAYFNLFSIKNSNQNIFLFIDIQGGEINVKSVSFDKDWMGNIRINTPFPDGQILGTKPTKLEQHLGIGGRFTVFKNIYVNSSLGLGYYTLFNKWYIYDLDNLEGEKIFSRYFSFGLEYVLSKSSNKKSIIND